MAGVDEAGSLVMIEVAGRRRIFVALQLLVALLAIVPIVYAMPRALDLSFDSIQYLSAGRSLLAGHGLSVFGAPGRVRPMTHFPPLYPAMLAALGALCGDVARGAWVLNVIAAAATVLLVARLARRVAGGEGRGGVHAALIAGVATAVTNDLAVNGTMLWSEPLFIVLVVATAGLLIRSVDREERTSLRRDPSVALAALAAGASALTRYAGVGIIAGGVLALLLASRLAVRARFRRAVVFGALSTAPLCVWLVSNELRAGTATDRALSMYVISRNELWVGLETLSRWVFPFDPTGGIGMAAALVVAAIIAYVLHETMHPSNAALEPSRDGDTRRAAAVLSILIASYGFFLLASITFVEHAASLDERLLSPALPLVIALAVGAGSALLTRDPGRSTNPVDAPRRRYARLRVVAISALAASLGDQAVGLVSWVRRMPDRSPGLTQLSRSADELLGVVRAIPSGARIYSNMPYMTYAFANRVVADLPQKISQTSLEPNPRYLMQLHRIGAVTDSGPAYLVFFDSPFHPPFYTSVEEAMVAFPTAQRRRFRGGQVLVVAAR